MWEKNRNVGKTIYGFCDGYFGRDDYATKVIIFETKTCIVCKYIENKGFYYEFDPVETEYVSVVRFESEEEKNQRVKLWKTKIKEGE